MSEKTDRVTPDSTPAPRRVTLEAEPAPLELDLWRTGVVIVDMQNAFLAKGAYIDIMGLDTGPGRAAIEPIRRINNAARAKGCKVIYIVTAHHPGDAGTGPDSVYWHKEKSLVFYRARPEVKDKLQFGVGEASEEERENVQGHVRQVTCPVHATLGSSTITVQQFINLQIGDLLVLDERVDARNTIYVKGKPLFKGIVGKRNRNRAVQITDVIEEEVSNAV